MDINIKGNPGEHNTFADIHIGHVEHYYPNATTVTNYYGDGHKRNASASDVSLPADAAPSTHHTELIERQRDDILAYVNRILKCVTPEYALRYEQLWRDILAIPEVAAEVYNPGKQQHTTFNRNLVAGIIGMMKNEGIITETNVTRLTELLEGDKEHSVRNALAAAPSRVISNKVRARIEALKTCP